MTPNWYPKQTSFLSSRHFICTVVPVLDYSMGFSDLLNPKTASGLPTSLFSP